MQFIAEDPVHVVVRNEIPALVDGKGGIVRPAQRRLYAKFTRGVAPDWAREIGVSTYGFKKMPEGVTADQWLAYYDTVEAAQQLGWNDEERSVIEQKLLTVDGVLLVEKPRLAPPWPAYDKIVARKGGLTSAQVAEKIVAKVVEDEYDPSHVAAYERENRARKSVLAELDKIAPPPPAPVDEYDDEEELVEA